ncbi:N-acetyltransferase ESCO2 [Armadillidium nasatum]|uniref:N-acetyltransferase ESCO2 n=1 Tax=Armadillidium nasatum TaxID=96803 RepID=A0A5N5T589_9CRUS|nr:N-acetyltransferase ESCO2 [Armadillidium nasatum]
MEIENLLYSDDEEKLDRKKKDPGFDVLEKIKELMKKPSSPQKKMSQKVSRNSSSQGGINKGVRHCIKRPKFKKMKIKEGHKGKRTQMKEKNVKMPQRLPSNRSPVKKPKWHKLSSPGTSLLETPESSQDESPLQSPKFFTSRSKAAAIVRINKSVELSTKNGELSINHRPSAFEKKNIGRIVELELEKKIAAATLNSPVNVNRLEEAGQLSSVSSCSTPPKPTRFIRSPSPKRSSLPITPKGTPSRKNTPRKQLLKAAAINSSPSRSPRFSPYSRKSTPKNDLNTDIPPKQKFESNRRVSPRKRKSLLKSLNNAKEGNKCFENGGLEVDDKEALEDFDSAFDSIKNHSEEDAILANILKENQSPEKESTFVRRSPRKHMSIEDLPQDKASKKTSKNLSVSKQNERFKYFPIFEPRQQRSADLAKVQKKKFVMKKGDPSQLVIDAGQKKFGHVFCQECGVLYEVGDPEDENYHLSVHYKIFSNLKFNNWKNERQVTILDELGGRILKVASDDHNQWWKKVKDVLKIVDEELGFSENCLRCLTNSSAYLYILDKQVVGVLIAESIEKAYKVIQIENVESQKAKEDPNSDKFLSNKLICCSKTPTKVSFGISRIWVLSSYRGKGIAAKLVDAMRGNSISWCYLKVDDFAFSDPTPNGIKFACKYTKKNDFLE